MIVLFLEVLYYSNFIIGSWKEVWVSNIWVIDTYSVFLYVCINKGFQEVVFKKRPVGFEYVLSLSKKTQFFPTKTTKENDEKINHDVSYSDRSIACYPNFCQ